MQPNDSRRYLQSQPPQRQQGRSNGTLETSDKAAQIVRGQIEAIYRRDPTHTITPTTVVSTDTTLQDAMAAQLKNVETPQNNQPPTANQIPEQNTPEEPSIIPGPGAVNMQDFNNTAPNKPTLKNDTSDSQKTVHREASSEDWQKYHSAWQSYYQQYYERYYIGQHINQTKLEQSTPTTTNSNIQKPESITNNEAMDDIRSKIRTKVTTQAKKIRKSRHFIPIASAAVVLLVFAFLQYNRVVFATIDAYITPGSIEPSALIVDPNNGVPVSGIPKLVVPKISVDVPIIWDADASSQDSLNSAMDKGVVWFNILGANAKPGQLGNFVLSGHSSNDWLDKGDYKFIFARLEQLQNGDTIYVDYQGTRYIYTITGQKVVKPTDVASLQIGTEKPTITLVTCTPLGTALNRLLVFGEQVSPNPKTATNISSSESSPDPNKMPANSPTFLERLFGAN